MIGKLHADGWFSYRIPYRAFRELMPPPLTMIDESRGSRVNASDRCVLVPEVTEWLEQQGIDYRQNSVYRKNRPSDVRLLFKDPRAAMAFKFRFG